MVRKKTSGAKGITNVFVGIDAMINVKLGNAHDGGKTALAFPLLLFNLQPKAVKACNNK